MTFSILAYIAAPFLMQSVPMTPAAAPSEVPPSLRLNQLSLAESAAPRCGIAFAVISRWQKSGDPRGSAYPDMEAEGGREFFVRSMAALMESREVTREVLSEMIFAEVNFLDNAEGAERVDAMMPTCLLLKQSAGL